MIRIVLACFFSFINVFFSIDAIADVKIAVIGKMKNDSFYLQAYQGCQYVADSVKDMSCLLMGHLIFKIQGHRLTSLKQRWSAMLTQSYCRSRIQLFWRNVS